MNSVNVLDCQKKFMYIKQELLQSIKQNRSTMLINPKFVNTAVIKPHFNKQFLNNQTIHINPNVIRNHEQLSNSHRIILTKREETPRKSNTIVNTPTKIVRNPKVQNEVSSNIRLPIHTKYKIIRGSTLKPKINTTPIPVKHKSCFKIDRRIGVKKSTPLKNINIRQPNKSKYVRMNKVINRKSNEGKSKSPKTNAKQARSALKLKILTIRGQKYQLNSSHHTLTLIQNKCDNQIQKSPFKTIYLGGMTYKQKEPNVFVKSRVQQSVSLRLAKRKSINILTNTLKKSNLPCPFYRKFGKCKGKETGKCIRKHNPEQIALCPKFIQGACTNNNCLLSHKISAEKMPTCKFFLKGLCFKDDCQYLHVKISNKAEICKDFLEGFCRKAAECEKRHEYLCSDFEKTGKCVKKNCQYPHGNVVRTTAVSKLMTKKLQGRNNQPKTNHKKLSTIERIEVLKEDVDEKMSVRYYDDAQKKHTNFELADNEALKKHTDSESADNDVQSSSPGIRKRPKLGILPSFIPFTEK